jgi:hypothetical protein
MIKNFKPVNYLALFLQGCGKKCIKITTPDLKRHCCRYIFYFL